MNEFLKNCLMLFASCLVTLIVLGDDSSAGDVLCYDDSCEKIECPKVNCTNGALFKSPNYECGCCEQCILYLSKDQTCGPKLSDRECGPGLTCASKDERSYFCMKKNTTCVQAQYDFDDRKQNGKAGMYEARPECDREGEYAARKCTPGGSCYCINKEGKRIFGEGLPDAVLSGETMDCQCARDYVAAQELGALGTAAFFHCLPNGNYDKLQCIAQACFCINPADQSLTSNNEPITNVENLPCFKEEVHFNKYYRPCEIERNKARRLRYWYNSNNVTVLYIDLPVCTPDGYYHPIRKSESKMFCANPLGEMIEDFQVSEDSPSAENMTCNCARSRYWLDTSKVSKPICCKNGNFRPIQCRGGACFCVDENGEQQGIEVSSASYTTLSCYKSAEFPNC